VSRFPIREHLVSYAEADLAAIVARAAARDGVPIDEDAAPELAADRATVDRGLVRQALEAAGYDEDGLLPIERQALQVLPELLRQGLITVTPRGRLARAQLRAAARDAARGGGRGTYATLPPLFATG
jgi:Holliday junction resolvasome RuvABC ATP-dependent DNA helicase subunit